MKKYLFIFCLMSIGLSIKAQTGQEGFNYQAVLRDNSNQPIKDQSINVKFRILTAPNGTSLYAENQQTTTDGLGLFNLIIGENKPDFTNINWGSGDKYLEVTVNVNGNDIPMGISRLQAVPFAKYALSAPSSPPSGNAGGDLNGSYPNPGVRSIQNKAVSSANPVNGQVLKWDGTANLWKPDQDNGQVYSAGPGIQVNGNQINNTGDINASDDVTINSTAGGDVTGTFNNMNVVKIQNKEVANNSPSNGQVLKWDGTANQWKPDQDNNQTYVAGTGIQVNGNQINNTGDTNASDDVTNSTTAGGDVTGTFNNLNVVKIQNKEVASNSPSNGQVLKWDGTANLWKPDQDNNQTYVAGTGIQVNGNQINNTGDTNAGDDVTNSTTAGGDINGTFSNLQIAVNVVGTNEIQNGSIKVEDLAAGVIEPSHWEANGDNIHNTNNAQVLIGNVNGSNLGLLNINTTGKNAIDGIYVEGPVTGNALHLDPRDGIAALGIHPQSNMIGAEILTTGDALAIKAATSVGQTVAEFEQQLTNSFFPPTVRLKGRNPGLELLALSGSSSFGNISFKHLFSSGGISKRWDLNGSPDKLSFSWTHGDNLQFINGSDPLTLTSNGNVGINNVSPNANLEVNSTIRISPNTSGSILELVSEVTPNINRFQFDAFKSGNDNLLKLNRYLQYGTGGVVLENLFEINPDKQNFFFKSLNYKIASPTTGHVEVTFPPNRTDMWLSGKESHIFFEEFAGGKNTFIRNDPAANVLSIQNNNPGGKITLKASNSVLFDAPISVGDQFTGKGLVEVHSSRQNRLFNYTAFIQNGNFNNSNVFPKACLFVPDGGVQDYSIWVSRRIACDELDIQSDRRIKNIIQISDSKPDLEVLNKIEITDYTYKDPLKGTKLQKKVIGQQVAEVFAQAVSTNVTEIVPDIMQFSKIANQWIILPNHNISKGDKVRLVFDSLTQDVMVIDVKSNEIKVESTINDKVLVYGKEVNDFHVVDYDAIAMLNVSATQELSKQIDLLKTKNKTLADENTILRSKLESLESSVASILEHLSISSKNSLANEK